MARPDNAPGSTSAVGIKPQKLPANYVDQAEELIQSYIDPITQKKKDCISTSKLRNLMTFTADIYDLELRRTDPRMSEASLAKVNQMRLRTAYECGRDNSKNSSTRIFIERAHLLEYLKRLAQDPENSRREALDFARYMEALVAYHRFYGLGSKEEK